MEHMKFPRVVERIDRRVKYGGFKHGFLFKLMSDGHMLAVRHSTIPGAMTGRCYRSKSANRKTLRWFAKRANDDQMRDFIEDMFDKGEGGKLVRPRIR